ncbi:MAG: hypothetical protein ACI4RP_09300 [Acutalibacteraceae bacterium]
MTVTFFGHRDTPSEIQPLLENVIKDLIENNGANKFYVGNQGGFDSMVKHTLRKLKQIYPHISYAVVLAYMPNKSDAFDSRDDTDTIYPEGLENTPKRFAIDKRNRWMLNKADTVVTYVIHSFGGAAKLKELAVKRGKRVINIADMI